MMAYLCYDIFLHEFRNRGRNHNWIYMSQKISHQIFYLCDEQSMYFFSSIAKNKITSHGGCEMLRSWKDAAGCSRNWNVHTASCLSCLCKGLIAEMCQLHGQQSGQPRALGTCARCPKHNQAMPMVRGIEWGGAKLRAPGPALSLTSSPRREVPLQQPQPFHSHWESQPSPPPSSSERTKKKKHR